MSDTTARLRLPTIRAGQAQKEISHNEALALIDLLIQASVVGIGDDTPPAAPLPGQTWVVGPAPVQAWTGQANRLAGWTEGGWRFVAPTDGMAVWVSEASVIARFSACSWSVGTVVARRLMIDGNQVVGARQAAIATPMDGETVDSEARSAVSAVLGVLRTHGLIDP